MLAEGYSAYNVRAAHDADDLVTAHHRQTLYSMRRHELSNFLYGIMLGDANNFLGHDCLYVLALLGNDICFRNNPDYLAVLAGNRCAADLIFDQHHRQFFYGDRRTYCDDISSHYVLGKHRSHLQILPGITVVNAPQKARHILATLLSIPRRRRHYAIADAELP